MKKADALGLSCLVVAAIFLLCISAVPQVAAQIYPQVTISANPTSGPAPLTVDFSAVASGGHGPPYTYSWDFGDGSPESSEQNPTHTYNDVGVYDVMFHVLDSAGYWGYGDVTIYVTTSTTSPTSTTTTSATTTTSTTPTTTSTTSATTTTSTTPTTTTTPTSTTAPTTTTTTTGTSTGPITFTDIQGNVRVERNGVEITTSQLQSGDRVITGEGSSATINFPDGSIVMLSQNSSFGLTSTGGNQSVMELLLGKIHAWLSTGSVVHTIYAVCSVRGTEFVLEVAEDGTTILTVLSDTVAFSDTGATKTVLVEQNQTSVVTPGGEPSNPVPTQGTPVIVLIAVAGTVTAIIIVIVVLVIIYLRRSPKKKVLIKLRPSGSLSQQI